MILSTLGAVTAHMLYFTLHVLGSGGSFPKPLSAEEEEECLRKMKEGDTASRNKLIEHNLRLVAHIIKKYYANAKDQDDLVSIGTIGLIKAVSTFDRCKGTRLATYASRCIENEILMYFRSQRKTQGDVSMDEPIESDKDGNELTLRDILAVEDNILEDVDLKIKIGRLSAYLRRLSARERMILELRYGIGGRRPMAQREVAAVLGISRSYISRLEKKAIGELKNMFSDD